jgi:peroxiredoxin
MSAAEVAARPAGRSAGRAQTIIVILITIAVIAAAAILISSNNDSGVTVADTSGMAASAPQPGQLPPGFTAQTYDGKTVNLADYAGKPLWLTFGASWCRDCRVEIDDVEAAYKANQAKGLNLLAVFVAEPASDVSGYAGRAGLTFPIAVDQKMKIANLYRVLGYPTHIFIGADGKIVSMRNGAMSRDDMDRAIASILN